MQKNHVWKTSRREFPLEKTLVMGILNVTPDSFSDGGNFLTVDEALKQAEKMISEGADILDIGGESTRPKAETVSIENEIKRVVPIITEICKRFDIAVSIDTTKSEVADQAVKSGAEIINDVSGLRFDEKIAEVASKEKTGLILMHLRGTFETMHKQESVADILPEVSQGFRQSIEKATAYGVEENRIALDVGFGFGKSFEQNLELLAKLDKIIAEFPNFPMLVGTSRKSFIGKILDDAPVSERLHGTTATTAISVWNGAKIIRVHDVKAAVDAAKTVEAIKKEL